MIIGEDACAVLLERLLVASADSRREILSDHASSLDVGFFKFLKIQASDWAEKDPPHAHRIAAIALEAAPSVPDPECAAYAWWGQGNVLLPTGAYTECLAAYTAAATIFGSRGKTYLTAQLQSNSMLPLMDTGRYAKAQALGQAALPVIAAEPVSFPMANLSLNLGICALRQGQHLAALEHIERAVSIFTHFKAARQLARSQVTLSVALRSLDRFAEAEALLRDALQILAGEEAWVPWARAALNLGNLRARLCDHRAALYWLAESHRAFERTGVSMDAALANLYRVRSWLDVHMLPEALAGAEEALRTFETLGMPQQEARAAAMLARVYTQCDRLGEARRAFERARRILQDQGDAVESALLDVDIAALLYRQGQPLAALHTATAARELLDLRRYPLDHAEASMVLAACCEDLGLLDEAQAAYRVAWVAGSHPTGSTEPPAFLAYRIAYARGVIAEAAGMTALARGEYERAVGYLERVAQGLGLDELRGGYLTDKRRVYEAALRLALAEGRIAAAFRTGELARAGALRAAYAAASPSATPATRAPSPELETLKARWAWRSSWVQHPENLHAEAYAEPEPSEPQPALAQTLADLERELADAYREQRLSDPRSAILTQGAVPDLSAVQAQLESNAALLVFDSLGDDLLAFVITPDAICVTPLCDLATLRWEAAALRHALEEVRLFDDPGDLAQLEVELRVALHTLYELTLAAPLAHVSQSVSRLWIVPCDVLHTLPFETLYDGRQYLIERYGLAYLASASLLTVLPQERVLCVASAGSEALIMACNHENMLPQAEEEAVAIAQIIQAQFRQPARVLCAAEATTEALRAHASAAGLLHLVVHGAFRADAPLFSTLYLADAPLTVHEVYGLDLSQTALVVLSGCQTGLAEGRGGEWLGLAHACHFAGAPTLVVSRWRVDDAATAELMRKFYAALARGLPVAESLRAAQLAVLSRRPHAYYWAGFAVLGRGFDAIFEDSSD